MVDETPYQSEGSGGSGDAVEEPAGPYGTQRDYHKRARPAAEARLLIVKRTAIEAFKGFLTEERCVVINFRDMNAVELGRILSKHPLLAKPLMILCNVAERAIERDLGLKGLNSYKPRFLRDSARALAGYLKPFLPEKMELESFCAIDRLMFLDKEIRKGKGRWEQTVKAALVEAAYPASGSIFIAVDVKRIEARRDIHKRCDEIVNKAAKFKGAHPGATFIAFIYYPFTDEHTNVSNRLKSENIDVTVFASEHPDSIRNAAISALKTIKS